MLELMRILLQVIASGSFSKAAAVLNMAPSSIARSIDNLESRLGVTLLHRSTRHIALTDEGEHFVVHARNLLEDTDKLIASMRHSGTEPSGTLRISVFESFGAQVISPLLAEFLQQHPKAAIDIDLDNRVVDLHRENVDLAIRIGNPTDSSLKARRLMPNQTLLCAAPAYLDKVGRPTSPEAITQLNCLLLSHDRQRHYWHFRKDKQHLKLAVTGNLTSKGGTPLLVAAEGGAGLLLLSSWMTAQQVKQGKLEVCLPDWQVSQYENGSGEIYAVYKGGKYPNPLRRAFIDFLVARLQPTAGTEVVTAVATGSPAQH